MGKAACFTRRLGPASGAASFRRRLGSASFRAPGMATWSGDSAGERCDPAGHPQGVPLRSSGIGSFKEVPHRRAAGMIRPETGRGWSIRGAHRVADVQRLGPYWAGGWRDGSAGERCDPGGHPQGAPLRSSGIEVTKKKIRIRPIIRNAASRNRFRMIIGITLGMVRFELEFGLGSRDNTGMD